MTKEEISRETEPVCALQQAGSADGAKSIFDPRILIIARAIRWQIAREQLKMLQAANDDNPIKK